MKILLFSVCENPDYLDEELGLAYLTAVLRQKGHEVLLKIFSPENIDYPSIVRFQPRVIGISIYDETYHQARNISQSLKEKLPGTYICWGGHFPSSHNRAILAPHPFIDFVIPGEGEKALVNLIDQINRTDIGTAGGPVFGNRAHRIEANSVWETVANLDELPFPSRDVLVQHGLKVAKIVFARGCKANCRNCGNKTTFRSRSVKNIIDEMEYIMDTFQVDRFDILDHSLANNEYLEKQVDIAGEIMRRGLKLYYYLHIGADFADKAGADSVKYLIQSGLCGVYINMETGNEADRKLYGKTVSISDYQKTLSYCENLNINTAISFINFNPYSTFESLRVNTRFLADTGKASFFYHSHHLVPCRSSPMFEMLLKDGLLTNAGGFDNYECEYRDDRVGNLIALIKKYFAVLNKIPGFYLKFCYFTVDYLNLLAYLKRRFANEPPVLRMILDNEIATKQILQSLAQNNTLWFEELLDLAEYGWDEQKALAIMTDRMNVDLMTKYLQSLEIQKNKLGIHLLRLNPEYLNFL
jgi:anaerobic magnesium-protoporphyrin IX monomethyl ester cyclase